MGDEDLVGAFSLLGDLVLFAAPLLVVVCRAWESMVTAAGRRPGSQLELVPLMGDQALSAERIVLIFGDQMPGEHGEFAAVATIVVWKPRRARIR